MIYTTPQNPMMGDAAAKGSGLATEGTEGTEHTEKSSKNLCVRCALRVPCGK